MPPAPAPSPMPARLRLALPDPAATDRLGRALAAELAPGDSLLLSGDLGAGKSALARALIREMLGDPEAEVPSPSYTLVNLHETPAGPVWHVDLYRLSGAEEAWELGLEDAFATELVLVEWPERLGGALPARRLEIGLSPLGEGRLARIAAIGGGWNGVLAALSALGAQETAA